MGDAKDGTASEAKDLYRVVTVNEEIKKVVQISSEVNLVALNAMLIAKRSGEKSRGFSVVSSELRVFSGKLERFMGELELLVFRLLKDVATMQKQSRIRREILATMKAGVRTKQFLAPALARKEAELLETGRAVKEDWAMLGLHFERALRLCETGGALSRSAKIEAVYGGDMTAALKQVANRIEQTVESILSILKALKSRVAG